jgi:hypothetical protein
MGMNRKILRGGFKYEQTVHFYVSLHMRFGTQPLSGNQGNGCVSFQTAD